jgi:hypothetical protein
VRPCWQPFAAKKTPPISRKKVSGVYGIEFKARAGELSFDLMSPIK